jgi:hypothetical protein
MPSTKKKHCNCFRSKELENKIERVLLKKDIQERLQGIYSYFHYSITPCMDQIPDP